MRHISAGLLAALLLLVSVPAAAQTLWQATRYGMSLEEAKAAVPGANSPNGTPSKLATGAVEKLRLDGFEVVGRPFTVRMYFQGDALEQVTLSLSETVNFDGATTVFERLRTALNSLYGKPDEKPEQRGVLSIRNADWQAGRTNISMVAIGVAQNPATLNVNYQVRVAKDADKL